MKVYLLIIFVVLIITLGFMLPSKDKHSIPIVDPTAGKPPIGEYFAKLEQQSDLAKLTLSGGCFWCMEGPFEAQTGVKEVIAGYAGGTTVDPSYEDVIAGTTGHRESVQIYFYPDQVTIDQLLDIYFRQIDPTDAEGQFADRGFQYTTAIFYRNGQQQQAAEKIIAALNKSGKYQKPIATQITPFTNFYPAEEYHQDFYINSATRYQLYKQGSGRADYIEQH